MSFAQNGIIPNFNKTHTTSRVCAKLTLVRYLRKPPRKNVTETGPPKEPRIQMGPSEQEDAASSGSVANAAGNRRNVAIAGKVGQRQERSGLRRVVRGLDPAGGPHHRLLRRRATATYPLKTAVPAMYETQPFSSTPHLSPRPLASRDDRTEQM